MANKKSPTDLFGTGTKETDVGGPSRADSGRDAPPTNTEPSKRELEKDRKRKQAEFRQAVHRELGPSKKRLDELEKAIEAAEQSLAELEEVLADPKSYEDAEASRELTRKHGELIADLNHDMAEWETLSEEYETKKSRLEADFGMGSE